VTGRTEARRAARDAGCEERRDMDPRLTYLMVGGTQSNSDRPVRPRPAARRSPRIPLVMMFLRAVR